MAHPKSVYGNYRQNGEGSIVPQGTIVQPSHWGWTAASTVLALAILGFILFPNDFMSLVTWAFSPR